MISKLARAARVIESIYKIAATSVLLGTLLNGALQRRQKKKPAWEPPRHRKR